MWPEHRPIVFNRSEQNIDRLMNLGSYNWQGTVVDLTSDIYSYRRCCSLCIRRLRSSTSTYHMVPMPASSVCSKHSSCAAHTSTLDLVDLASTASCWYCWLIALPVVEYYWYRCRSPVLPVLAVSKLWVSWCTGAWTTGTGSHVLYTYSTIYRSSYT